MGRIHTKKTTVVDCSVADQHIFLRLNAPGFRYVPGQWAQLSIPSLSTVPHPFTIVPDSVGADEHLQFIIRVRGLFTQRLAESWQSVAPVLQGPYGNPPLPASDIQGVVFVLGGAGVTPALSLVREASKTYANNNVRVYWNVRSRELLHHCAPLLEPHLKVEQQCIRLTPTAGPSLLTSRGTGLTIVPSAKNGLGELPLPLGAGLRRLELDAWLASVAEQFAHENISTAAPKQQPTGDTAAAPPVTETKKNILLYVCGPPSLVKTAQEAVIKDAPVAWKLHIERFEFLPLPASGNKATLRPETPPIEEGCDKQQLEEDEDLDKTVPRSQRGGAYSAWRAGVQDVRKQKELVQDVADDVATEFTEP